MYMHAIATTHSNATPCTDFDFSGEDIYIIIIYKYLIVIEPLLIPFHAVTVEDLNTSTNS